MSLVGKKVLVMGVGSGLGPATSYFLLKGGADIVIVARNESNLKKVKKELSGYGKIDYIVADLSTISGARKAVDQSLKKLGKIDHLAVLVGNYMDTPIKSLSEEKMESMIGVNLKAPIYAVKEALPHLKGGSAIVMVSSIEGTYGHGLDEIVYASAKAGLAKATELLAYELLDKNIRVNAVAPKAMRHDFEPEREWKKSRKLGDIECPPEDVAKVIMWLLDDESEWINGAVIPVDGGARLK